MPLEHVSMWQNGVGWKRITAEKASHFFSYTVPADTKCFICDLCHNYVTFVNQGQMRCHFKHSRGDINKECDDRSQNFSRREEERLRSTITYPLKIHLNATSFFLEIGFLPLPFRIMASSEKLNLQVLVSAGKKLLLTKNITPSNFSTEETVFYPIDHIAEEYVVRTASEGRPHKISELNYTCEGVNSNGTLFDFDTGKKIPIDGDIEVGKKYYLLISNGCVEPKYPQGVLLIKKLSQDGFSVYLVSANVISKSTSEFFLKFRARLTDKPTQLIAVWPIVCEGDHCIKTKRRTLFFVLKGDSSVKVEPFSCERAIDVYSVSDNPSLQLVSLENISRIRMVWAVRLSVLRYISLNYDVENISQPSFPGLVSCEIRSEDGTPFNKGVYHALPRRRQLHIKTPYEGKIVHIKNGEPYFSQKIKAETEVMLDKISYDDVIHVYQGLDLVASVEFIRQRKENSLDDKNILLKLKSCTGDYVYFSPRYGRSISKLSDIPKTKLFLLNAIRDGFIRIDALKIFIKVIQNYI
ncbi:MAG: hypothetical protein ACOX4X_02935 [Aminobacterium colombiense]|jgi:hypothetical protein|uniref:hypothetical protein n=1 Tax=Aminobacterium colombiense TaxID=81468 RepID=UPI003D967D4D